MERSHRVITRAPRAAMAGAGIQALSGMLRALMAEAVEAPIFGLQAPQKVRCPKFPLLTPRLMRSQQILVEGNSPDI